MDKTNYSVINPKGGRKSTLTLDKISADVLQIHLPNVHDWVQDRLDRVAKAHPTLGRKQHGEIVRRLADLEAAKYPEYDAAIRDLLG